MEDDIETVEINDDGENVKSKPLLNLFQRLIGNNKPTQNTVLTNAEIIIILKDDFNIEVDGLHELEVDIYLNVMKKFLKDWPKWDEFDQVINTLKMVKDSAGIKKVLEAKYEHLKKYLKAMLEATEPIAKETIKSLPPTPVESTSFHKNTKDANDVVLEVCCTRAQLNRLILKHPIPGKDMIFNMEDVPGPSRISLMSPSFNTIINWWCFSLNINLSCLVLKRDCTHELKHFLVNKNLNMQTDVPLSNTCFQEKITTKTKNLDKAILFDVLNKVGHRMQNTPYKYVIDIMVSMLKKDFEGAPSSLKVPSMYRKCMSKHPYVRHLSTDLAPDTLEMKKYDLDLEETIIPMYQLQLAKLENSQFKINLVDKEYRQKIFIECKECKIKFGGLEILKDTQHHFAMYHQNEPDWQCRTCGKAFAMTTLADRWWHHMCSQT